jgi:hypothetical protein
MKKIIGLLGLTITLLSCTAEPLPSDIKTYDNSIHTFAFDWESNQIKPYATMQIYPYDGSKTIKIDTIKTKHFEYKLHNGDTFWFGVNYLDSTPRPECSLNISRASQMDLGSGVYTPNWELEYTLTAPTNGIGYSGFITNEGKVKD